MPERVVNSVLDSSAAALADPIAEANHRIANNLAIIAALIRSEVLKLPNSEMIDPLHARQTLEQMSLRIEAVGRLHRLLMDSGDGGRVLLSAYLREIADAAMCSLTNFERTDMLFDMQSNAVLGAKQAAAIGLIVGEALTNALKYAHAPGEAGQIWIACRAGGNEEIVIEISDDGAGIPESLDLRTRRGGTGTRLMRGLAQQLEARLDFVKTDHGQTVRLSLPASSSPPQAQQRNDESEMAMLVARAKLTEVLLDAEALGNGAFVASILMVKGDQLYHLAAPNLPVAFLAAIDGIEIGPSAGSCGTAAYCGHAIYVADLAADPLWAAYPEIRGLALAAGLHACWSMPIFYSGRLLGTFAIYHRETRTPTVAERTMIRDAAASAAGLLEQLL